MVGASTALEMMQCSIRRVVPAVGDDVAMSALTPDLANSVSVWAAVVLTALNRAN